MSLPRVEFLEIAAVEQAQAAAEYEELQQGLGERFLRESERVQRRMAEMPMSASRYLMDGVRLGYVACFCERFPLRWHLLPSRDW